MCSTMDNVAQSRKSENCNELMGELILSLNENKRTVKAKQKKAIITIGNYRKQSKTKKDKRKQKETKRNEKKGASKQRKTERNKQ